MSTASESTKPSTTAADNVGKEQHDFPKNDTVEQDTAVDDTLQGSLDTKIPSEDHSAATSDGSSPGTNAVPGADLALPDVLTSPQGADNGEIWIPKGGHNKPNAPETGPPQGPKRPPSKPKHDN